MRTLIGIARLLAQALYLLARVRPRRRKVVLFSRQADRPSRDFRMLVDELRARDPSLEIVVRCRFVPTGLMGRVAYAGEVFAQMWHLANASVCIVDGYIVPVSVLEHGKGLTVIQTWHALGAVKCFGLQSVGRAGGRSAMVAQAMRMHRNYDQVLCGGPGSVPAFAEAFGVPESAVVPIGLPRVDALRAAVQAPGPAPRVATLIEAHPLLADGRTRVLYAPTFRRNRKTGFTDIVDAFEGSGCVLLVKPHDLERAVLSGEHVVDATGVDMVDLLAFVDVVVTDYSAVAFEAAVIKKPVYFYVYDVADYEREIGLNMDPRRELPQHTSTDARRIVEMVLAGLSFDAELKRFAEHHLSVPDGGCTAAIVARVLRGLPGGDGREC